MDAAAHFGLTPAELAYRPVEKKHGLLRRPRVVIEVDPENPRRQPASPAPPPPADRPREAAAERRARPEEARRAQPPAAPRRAGQELTPGAPSASWESGGELAPAADAVSGATAAAAALVALAGVALQAEAGEREGAEGREVRVDLRGADRPALVARQGELLRACRPPSAGSSTWRSSRKTRSSRRAKAKESSAA
jgi:hypothetical protein